MNDGVEVDRKGVFQECSSDRMEVFDVTRKSISSLHFQVLLGPHCMLFVTKVARTLEIYLHPP